MRTYSLKLCVLCMYMDIDLHVGFFIYFLFFYSSWKVKFRKLMPPRKISASSWVFTDRTRNLDLEILGVKFLLNPEFFLQRLYFSLLFLVHCIPQSFMFYFSILLYLNFWGNFGNGNFSSKFNKARIFGVPRVEPQPAFLTPSSAQIRPKLQNVRWFICSIFFFFF